MKYRVVRRNGVFVPQVKKNIKLEDIKETCYDPRDRESFKVEKIFNSEKDAINFIKEWHSENIDTETVVKEFEIN